MGLWPPSGYHPGLKEASMTTKRYPKKKLGKSGKDDPVPVRSPGLIRGHEKKFHTATLKATPASM